MIEKITAKRKPRKCPKCGCHKIASILYGYPIFSPNLEQEIAQGKVVLGGCCPDFAKWQCIECNTLIYRYGDILPGELP